MAAVMGTLRTVPALSRPDLLAEPVAAALRGWAHADQVQVAEIDPELADTAAFCAAYQVGLDISANCVVVAGKREGQVVGGAGWRAARGGRAVRRSAGERGGGAG